MADTQVDSHAGSDTLMTYAVPDTKNISSIESTATKMKNLFASRRPKLANNCPSQDAPFPAARNEEYLTSTPTNSGKRPENARSHELNYVNLPIPQQKKDRLSDIRCLFHQSLLNVVPGDILMKPKWVGDEESCAQLCIIVLCDDMRAVRKANKFFKQSHVREEVENDFVVHVIPGLQRLNGEELAVYGNPGLNVPVNGTAIQIRGELGFKTATLGGLVSVNTKGVTTVYGFTSGHSLPLREAIAGADANGEEDSEDSEDFDDSGSASETIDSPSGSSQDDRLAGDAADGIMAQEIGHVTRHSFESRFVPGSNYDWALISLLDDTHELSDVVGKSTSTRSFGPFPHNSSPLRVAETNWALYPDGIRAYAITARGNCRGRIASNASCIRVAPGTKTVETLDFIPDPYSDPTFGKDDTDEGQVIGSQTMLQPGDSGCWVIQETSGDIFGHVVSSDESGEVSVLPLSQVLQDIRSKLDADEVSVPCSQYWLKASIGKQQDSKVAANLDSTESDKVVYKSNFIKGSGVMHNGDRL
ncbi:hypothetical protein PG993_013721 [Apiospora rasikravindrae]|uniref:Uncharacterized protein n=1 Tax=Apiospora rasikravindrae TaxID=990691 RepID=A0ABR1RR10_9PEZI